MSNYSKILWTIPGIGTLLLVLAGCGESTGGVSGKVTYQGQAVTNGSIEFHMKNKGIAQGAKLDSAGKFTMSSPLPTGTYQVYYAPPLVEPQDPAKKGLAPEVKITVPTKYHDMQSSNMSVEVKSGKNDIPIEFKD